MQRLIFAALAWLLSTAALAAGKANIGTAVTNPSGGAVLATTGALVSGSPTGGANYLVQAFVSSTAAETFDLQTLSGGSAVAHIYVMVPANSSQTFKTDIPFLVADNLTLQIVAVNTLSAGAIVQANLLWELASTP